MIWFILGIGLILRLISLNQSLWLDEAINIVASQKFSFLGIITQYAVADFHPPGWFAILWIWGRTFGYSEIAMRLPSVIFGVVTIYVTYLLGKKLISKNLGLLAALLIAINPLHIYYSQEARMYALATLAVAINIFLWVKILKDEKVSIWLLVSSNLLVLSSDYVSYLIFPAQFILLISSKRKFIKIWVIGLLGAVLLMIWWLPIFLKQLSVGSVASANLPTWKFVVGGFDLKAIPLTFVKFIIGRISLADKFLYLLFLAPVCSLFLFLLFRGIKLIKGINRFLLILWISIPVLLASLSSLIIPIYSYFRLMFTLPIFLLLTALGVISFKSKLRYLFLGTVVFIQLLSVLLYLFNGAYQREDWRGLVSYLKSVNQEPIVLFESSGTLPPFDYYAKNEINAIGALKDFPAKNIGDVIDLKTALKGSTDIFLVNYLIDISDPNRLVAQMLDESGYSLFDTKDFNGVGFVYHYVRK